MILFSILLLIVSIQCNEVSNTSLIVMRKLVRNRQRLINMLNLLNSQINRDKRHYLMYTGLPHPINLNQVTLPPEWYQHTTSNYLPLPEENIVYTQLQSQKNAWGYNPQVTGQIMTPNYSSLVKTALQLAIPLNKNAFATAQGFTGIQPFIEWTTMPQLKPSPHFVERSLHTVSTYVDEPVTTTAAVESSTCSSPHTSTATIAATIEKDDSSVTEELRTTPQLTSSSDLQISSTTNQRFSDTVKSQQDEFSSSKSVPDKIIRSNKVTNIAETVEEIKHHLQQLKPKKSKGLKEGMPCSINGMWGSKVAGVNFKISNSSTKDYHVELTVSNTLGFFRGSNWTVTSQLPFPGHSLFILTAVHNLELHMATFTGECRVCGNKELITGHWLLMKNESTCQDLLKGEDYFGDVWHHTT